MTERVTVSEKKKVKPASPLRVMIIDPNPESRHRLKDSLRGIDFIESVADRSSPHHLLDILAEKPAHVIIVDENPGAGNVYDLVKLVKGKAVAARTQFVLMADTLNDEVRKKGTAAGIRGFIKKPYALASVEDALIAAVVPTQSGGGGEAKTPDGLRDTLDKLRRVSLFSGFSDLELVRLLKICRTRNFPTGKFVFREGDAGHSLFVLVAGKLEIQKNTGGETKVLVEMSPGDCFGEMAIIDDEPRMADAYAATDCTVIEVNESVINSNEDVISLKLVRQIAILLARKLRMLS